MTRKWCASLAFLGLGVLVGCHNSSSSTDSKQVAESQPAKVPIPADSPFAKVKEGMSPEEVSSLIGPPTSQGAYATGKAFIPFHYGGDNSRRIFRYKGMGTIIFSQNSSFSSGYSAIEVNYDPNEKGFE
jgi:hypothetical protein